MEAVLDQAEAPKDEEAVIACLLCRAIGPCLSAGCPKTHTFRHPGTGRVPAVLTALKQTLCTGSSGQASMLTLVLELPLAQAFLSVELRVSALLAHRHRLRDNADIDRFLRAGPAHIAPGPSGRRSELHECFLPLPANGPS